MVTGSNPVRHPSSRFNVGRTVAPSADSSGAGARCCWPDGRRATGETLRRRPAGVNGSFETLKRLVLPSSAVGKRSRELPGCVVALLWVLGSFVVVVTLLAIWGRQVTKEVAREVQERSPAAAEPEAPRTPEPRSSTRSRSTPRSEGLAASFPCAAVAYSDPGLMTVQQQRSCYVSILQSSHPDKRLLLQTLGWTDWTGNPRFRPLR